MIVAPTVSQHEAVYFAPLIEVVEVSAEQGFAASFGGQDSSEEEL